MTGGADSCEVGSGVVPWVVEVVDFCGWGSVAEDAEGACWFFGEDLPPEGLPDGVWWEWL